jgi:hypothetical protein
MSITYYSIAEKIFAASSDEISALKSLIDPRRRAWTMQITPTRRAIRSRNKLTCATASKELNWSGMKADGPTSTSEIAA